MLDRNRVVGLNGPPTSVAFVTVMCKPVNAHEETTRGGI